MADFDPSVFADIEPLPQDDGPDPIVPIAYSEEFVEVMGYFRAILKRNEKSERALALTGHVIDKNSANYSAWDYRRECLFELKSDLKEELKFAEETALRTPKNYQLWNHRRIIVDKADYPADELEHTAEVLSEDAKNYHAWAHRQWCLKRFNLWEKELLYVEALLKEDLRNNSAWNQRFYVIEHTTGFTKEVVEREIKFTLGYIDQAVNNDSPWNYLYGILNTPACTDYSSLREFTNLVIQKDSTCSQAHSFLVELCEKEGTNEGYTQAIETSTLLAESVDVIRKQYWLYRKEQFEAAGGTAAPAATEPIEEKS